MIEVNDVDQMLYAFNVEFEVVSAGDIVYKISLFGVQIIFSPSGLPARSTRSTKEWRTVEITANDNLEEKKMETFWALMRGGYMHYLRTEYKNLFKRMLNTGGWDRKIIEKRIELSGNEPKFNYLREYNRWAQKQGTNYLLSIDPGFFDFLLD